MDKFMIIIDGPMGSGKSTISKFLHKELKRTALLGTDQIKFFISDFERGERDNMIAAAVVMQMCKEYIRQGINLLLPQAFWKKEYLEPYLALAKENGLKVFMYQLEGPRELLLERIRNRPKPEWANTPVSEERILGNLKKWEENRYDLGRVFSIAESSSEQISKLILADIVQQ